MINLSILRIFLPVISPPFLFNLGFFNCDPLGFKSLLFGLPLNWSVHVAGFAPVVQIDGGEWNSFGRERVKEMDFLENSSQISSIDFWQGRSVSTGLGLSLDSAPIGSSDGSALLSLVRDDVERELQRQDAEIDRFLKIQVSLL